MRKKWAKATPDTIEAALVEAKATGERVPLKVAGAPGLAVRVSDGAATFTLRYRDRDSREQRALTIGKYGTAPGCITLAQARKHSNKLLSAAVAGTDPWHDRKAKRAAVAERKQATGRSVGAVFNVWMKSKEVAAWRPRTREEVARAFKLHVVPVIGDRDMNIITLEVLDEVFDKILEGGNAKQPGKRTANLARTYIRMLFAWATSRRQKALGVTAWPFVGKAEKPGGPDVMRDRIYTLDELDTIAKTLSGSEVWHLWRFISYTATRDTETRLAKWTDVNLDRAEWSIPATNAKNDLPRVVSLSAGALNVLREIRERSLTVPFSERKDTDYVFPYLLRRKPQKIIARVARALPFVPRLHDLRRTIGDYVFHNFDEAAQNLVLGHKPGRLTRTYAPGAMSRPTRRVVEALAAWGATLLARAPGAQEAPNR